MQVRHSHLSFVAARSLFRHEQEGRARIEPGFTGRTPEASGGLPGPLYQPRTDIQVRPRMHPSSVALSYPQRSDAGLSHVRPAPLSSTSYPAGVRHTSVSHDVADAPDDQEVHQQRSWFRRFIHATLVLAGLSAAGGAGLVGYQKYKQMDAGTPHKIESPSGAEFSGFTAVRQMIDRLSLPSDIKLPWILNTSKQDAVAASILHPQPETKGSSMNSPDVATFTDGVMQIKIQGYTRAEEIGVGGRNFVIAYPAKTQLPKLYPQGVLQRVYPESNSQEIKWRLEFNQPVQVQRLSDGTLKFFTTSAAATEQARVRDDMRLDENAGTIAAGQYRLVRAGGVKLRTITSGIVTLDGGSLQRGNTFDLTGKMVQVGGAWFAEVAGSKKYIPLRDERSASTVELVAAKVGFHVQTTVEAHHTGLKDADGVPVGVRYQYIDQNTPAPRDLQSIHGRSNQGKPAKLRLRASTVAAFTQLRESAASEGINLYVCAGYRSYADQQKEHSNKGEDTAEAPGYSEHHLGHAFDLAGVTKDSRQFLWLLQNAFQYGFVPTYYFRTGEEIIRQEPWHWRYVGPNTAAQFSAQYADQIQQEVARITALAPVTEE